MTEFVRFLLGWFLIRVRGAAPETALNRLTRARVLFWGVEKPDEFTCEFRVHRRDCARVLKLLEKSQSKAEAAAEFGLPVNLRFLRRRKLLLALAALTLVLVALAPRYVWFIRVEGNAAVPSVQIVRELRSLGVGFGTPCRSIVPQELKNKMLLKLPRLEWLTVNTSGGVATVVVRERKEPAKVTDRRAPTNLIASRDGLVTDFSVLSGYPACEVGKTVVKGQLLVSGYADYGYCTHACRAIAEVYARTWREQNAEIPEEFWEKSLPGAVKTTRYLIFGRKRIKISSDSGILPGKCDKMTVYRTLTLPGGYELPVRLETVTCTARALTRTQLEQGFAEALLKRGASDAARADMIAGTILRDNTALCRADGIYRLTGTYECREMIARPVDAKLFEGD